MLLEHQSRVDPDMPLRLADYHLRLCKQLRKHCPPGELPTVVPTLVSHAVGGWTGPRCYDDMFTCRPAWFDLTNHVPRFRMLLLDLARASDAELRSIGADPFAIATLWALREARNGDALLAQFDCYADVLRAMCEAPNGRDDSYAWLRYILDVGDGVTAKQLIVAVHHYAPELTEIAMTAADQLRQEGLKQGLKQGREQGFEEGLEQSRRDQVAMLASWLTQRFGPLPAPHRERLDRASVDQLRALAQQVRSVSSLDELFAGFDPER